MDFKSLKVPKCEIFDLLDSPFWSRFKSLSDENFDLMHAENALSKI